MYHVLKILNRKISFNFAFFCSKPYKTTEAICLDHDEHLFFCFLRHFSLCCWILTVMALDPKVKNLIIFLVTNLAPVIAGLYFFVKYSGITDKIKLFGVLVLLISAWRIGLSVYRRLIQPAKKPLEFGKWAIVTGEKKNHLKFVFLFKRFIFLF